MTRRLIIVPEAEEQIEFIDVWWRMNRQASPDLFWQELSDGLGTIREAPESGTRYHDSEVPGVRRFQLRSTRNHIYYVVEPRTVVVIAVWGAIKGRGPDLAPPE